MMTLEQIGALAMLWHEAETDVQARVDATPQRPLVRASQLMIRRHRALRSACRDYKLLEEARVKGANDGTV